MQVTVCDVCKRVGVETRLYKITEGERSVETDRCQEHSQPFEEALDPASHQVKETADDLPAPAKKSPAKGSATRKAPAKKAAKRDTAKKAAAQESQSGGGRGPVLTTIEAIDAAKKP
ncbi:hypothetical protein ABZ419_09665 [Streptomyces cinnamoneus]|uniref:hypothetical protein n=1 Tax=Streptomyces cinnamoneus TaxID=53446 RepID=UPI0033CC20A1